MKTINIILVTSDQEYGNALARSLQQHNRFFSIQMVQSAPGREETKEDLDYDILLTDDTQNHGSKTVYLTWDQSAVRIDENNKIFVIYKYQPVSQIVAVLRLAYSVYSKTEMLTDETEQTNIICVGASCGGSGCTSIALGICQELIRYHGKKVLYISLEEFESTAIYFPVQNFEPNNISKYLYALLNPTQGSTITPQGYLLQEEYGIDAFHPAKGRNPLRELTEVEFGKFINSITREKGFSHIILDCGNGLDYAISAAFQLAKTILFVEAKNTFSARQNTYLRTVDRRCGGIDGNELIVVRNFYVEPETQIPDPVPDNTKKYINIDVDFNSFEEANGRSFISLDKAFGLGIREVVERVK